jgi:hypothetical protein
MAAGTTAAPLQPILSCGLTDMANPFYVEPANPLQALMLGVQGYDRSQKSMKEAETRAARQGAADAYASGQDNRGALARLISLGDADTIKALGSLETKGTDEQREYAQAVGQGYKGTFMDYKTALKRAGATSVNVNTGEKSYDQTLNKSLADQFMKYQEAGRNATGQITTLDTMDKLTQDPNFYSGVGAERFALPMKQIISRMGGDPNAAASMETFRALSNKSVLDSMGGSLGTGFSNADRDFVVGQVANLGNTKEGNRELIAINRKVASRAQDVARLAREYAGKNGGRIDAGFDQALAQWAEANPLFPRQQAPQSPQSPQAPRIRTYNPATGKIE